MKLSLSSSSSSSSSFSLLKFSASNSLNSGFALLPNFRFSLFPRFLSPPANPLSSAIHVHPVHSFVLLTFASSLIHHFFVKDLEAELKKNIKVEPVEDPEGIMSLCYKNDADMDVPIVKVRFAGAELELKPSNTFVKVQEDMVCFAMIPATEVAIFGNLAQMDFLVGYDLEEGKVSFKSANCSHLQF
ncbi:probable aspartic protease At2g35615 [Spinacia oleracea]|uniref:Probable aspartic protease At2g35615 n=1 Tax=Spinacia oleracea TaxID=3562 RepID=A0ABM3R3W0_SPIOL|nr:probable aspartic protease At2g35615 [Spinacia oleracea]